MIQGPSTERFQRGEADPAGTVRRPTPAALWEVSAACTTSRGTALRHSTTELICFAALFLGVAAACNDSRATRITAPTQAQLMITEDSDPKTCLTWGCRTPTYEENSEIDAELTNAFYIYAGDGRTECMSLILNAMNTLRYGLYVGTTVVYGTDPSTGYFGKVIGEAHAPTGSVYVNLDYMRELGSVNGYVKTMVHEQFHLEDPNLLPKAREGYDWEVPAKKAANDCTI